MKMNNISIPDDKPFAYDKFNREQIADNLESIINFSEGSLVMSIDSGWGRGKTTFINMWKKKLDLKDEYIAIYFNAWENDDSEDPLLAIISEIESVLFPEKGNSIMDRIKTFGKPLLKSSVPLLLKIITNNILDIEKLKTMAEHNKDGISELVSKFGEIDLDTYKNQKNAKQEFKNALKELQQTREKKIIFFVDELDRCRPNFTVETLEKIKHLFDIDNFVFVLSIDKTQLANSLKTLYGHKMDTNGYLKRFIDIEYCLPEPDKEIYCDYLLEEYKLKNKCTNLFETYIKRAVKVYDLSLRELDKLFYYLSLIFPMSPLSKEDNYTYIYQLSVSAIYSIFPILKIKHYELYQDFIKKEFKMNFIEKARLNEISPKNDIYFYSVITSVYSLASALKNKEENYYGKYIVGDRDSYRGCMIWLDL